MNIKKLTSAVMAVTILAGMTACSDTANETAEVSETTTIAETTPTAEETTTVTEETTAAETTTTTSETTTAAETTTVTEETTTAETTTFFSNKPAEETVASEILIETGGLDMDEAKVEISKYLGDVVNTINFMTGNNNIKTIFNYTINPNDSRERILTEYKSATEFYNFLESEIGSVAVEDIKARFGAVTEHPEGLSVGAYSEPYLICTDIDTLDFVEISEDSCIVKVYRLFGGSPKVYCYTLSLENTEDGWRLTTPFDLCDSTNMQCVYTLDPGDPDATPAENYEEGKALFNKLYDKMPEQYFD